jgi:hypothetical protein
MILTRFYIFHTEVQIHIVGTLQFRFAKLKADHFAHMAKSATYTMSCIKRGDTLLRKVKLKTVIILVFNRVYMVITHVCFINLRTMYHIILNYVLYRIHISSVIVTRNKYYNPLKPCFPIVYKCIFIYL